MSSFISNAACHGHRPQHLIAYSGLKRPHLVSRLLIDRGVARFIVAPDGYGKTTVAIEYCETIFSWVHVIWIRCQKPCFLRDLDAGSIATQCLDTGDASLVVFDDLPPLDGQRADRLSQEIDALLEASCEVVVTCAPARDAFSALQPDRMVIGATDLLLDDEELADALSRDGRAPDFTGEVPSTQRVPCLVWGGGPNDAEGLLKSSLEVRVPSEQLLAVTGMYLLQRGPLAELRLPAAREDEILAEIADQQPHFHIDFDARTFEAPDIEVRDVAKLVKRRLDAMAKTSPIGDRGALAIAWANSLLNPERPVGRSCEIARELLSAKDCIFWAEEHAYDLVKLGCFFGTVKLIAALRAPLARERLSTQARIAALESVCLHLLDDDEGAIKRAKRFAFEDSPSSGAQICCLLVIARFGAGGARAKAHSRLREVLERIAPKGFELSFYEWLAHAQCALLDGVEALGVFWGQQQRAGASPDALSITAAWIFQEICDMPLDKAIKLQGKLKFDLKPIEQHVREQAASIEDMGGNLFVALSGLSLERMRDLRLDYVASPLPTSVLFGLRCVETSVALQRRLYAKDVQSSTLRQASRANAHPDSVAAGQIGVLAAIGKRNVPMLEVRLFGRFELSIGGELVDPQLYKRRTVSTLLALLVINRNHELRRESLARSIWPDSPEKRRMKSFYAAWSMLKKALTLPDGTCPYLIRSQSGCSIDSRYMQSDLDRFDYVCHEMLFSTPDFKEWPVFYNEIRHEFSGGLMPTERENDMLEQARHDCNLRLVEALLSASHSTVRAENAQWGIWFANAAVDFDRTREDAYVALMRAQIAANQRTAAMNTYLRCQKALSEELGIDPSPETTAIYQTLLESD